MWSRAASAAGCTWSASRSRLTGVIRYTRWSSHYSTRTTRAGQQQSWLRYMVGATALLGGTAVLMYNKPSLAKSVAAKEGKKKQGNLKGEPQMMGGGKNLQEAIEYCTDLLLRIKEETGSPGLVAAVSIDGKNIWSIGMGHSDIENRVACHPDAVMRIASISKPIAMTTIARLWESGALDLDKAVTDYLPEWPKKTFDGEEVTVTTRQLVSHLSGVRHYDKNPKKKNTKEKQNKEDIKESEVTKNQKQNTKEIENNKVKENKYDNTSKNEQKSGSAPQSEFDLKEYYIKQTYDTAVKALEIFKDDPLISKPGTEYLYTTWGFTLLSAIAEKVGKKPISTQLKQTLRDLGMENTYLDQHEPLIYRRARFYTKNKKGRIINTAYVDNSCKWAGGGLLSNTADLLKFGNAMLYSYQWRHLHEDTPTKNKENKLQDTTTENKENKLPGYLKPETMEKLWTPVKAAKISKNNDWYYGMGWIVVPYKKEYGEGKEQQFSISHTGAAIGASSVLTVLPTKGACHNQRLPNGIVVAIMVNMQNVGLHNLGVQIAEEFAQVEL